MHFYLGCASQSVACQHPGYVRSVMSATVLLYQFVTRSCVPSSLQQGRTWPLKHLMNVSRLGTSLFRVGGNVGMEGKSRAGSWLIPELAFSFTMNAWQITIEYCQTKS